MIYLDYAASSPMLTPAIEAYAQIARESYGNSVSLHDAGGTANYFVEQARKVIANKLGVNDDGIIFTGSGTESNILAIVMLAECAQGKHIISTMAEHTSVHAALNILEARGYHITRLPLQQDGIVSIKMLQQAITADTALITIQHVNSETGAIQPVQEIAKLAQENEVFYHVDCVQSFCKLAVNTFAQQVSAITVSAHKVGGPKGCGAIYLQPNIIVKSLTPGVTHERGLRGGTVDTAALVAFAVAVENYNYDSTYYAKLRAFLAEELPKQYQLITSTQQLPSICGLLHKKQEGQYVMLKLNEALIAVSTGSACDIHSESGTKAVNAMGYSWQQARQFFRVSMGYQTTQGDITALVAQLKKI